jgi:hypothetical protein
MLCGWETTTGKGGRVGEAGMKATLMVIFSSYIKIKGPVSCYCLTQEGSKRMRSCKNYQNRILNFIFLVFLITLSSDTSVAVSKIGLLVVQYQNTEILET